MKIIRIIIIVLSAAALSSAQIYNQSIPGFEQINGYSIGDKPAGYNDVVEYISGLSRASDRIELVKEGKTYQGRDLYYMIVTSPRNFKRIEQIKRNLSLLADPRLEPEIERDEIIKNTPATAFMMYSIHGNEASGTNASLKLAYELSANESAETAELLNNLIVIIYPMENPDGRERFISEAEQWMGAVENPDVQSYPHSGLWPSGRTNHYHFDLNRDWFVLSQPESRARVKAVQDWNPQLVVDAHEMGSFSTFLFNPPREPINPNMNKIIRRWWGVFAKDQAEAFDKYGWSYYTREWLEEWFPGYGTSWPSYSGAVAILYEQARTSGGSVKRPDGTILTYAESVEHQFVSSLANLRTASENRSKLLKEYYKMKKESLTGDDEIKAYIIKPDENKSRLNKFLSKILFQKIEVFRLGGNFSASNAVNVWGEKSSDFPEGSIVIPLNQPLKPLIKAIFDFDTRMTNDYLKSEKESILKGKGTRLYEVSAWSMPLAYGLDIYEARGSIPSGLKRVNEITSAKGSLSNKNSRYGFIIRLTDDNVYPALNELLNAGVRVNVADKPFTIEGGSYDRGDLLIRKIENPNLNVEFLEKIAEKYTLNIIGVNGALSSAGTDLGGGNFTLLTQPRTAFLVGRSISMNAFGSLWYLFDRELNMRTSKIDIDYLSRFDLSKYNVLILPPYYGSLKDGLRKSGIGKLKEWIKSGGTLISMGRGAEALADTSLKFSKVKLRGQVLSKLSEYQKALKKEEEPLRVTIDSLMVWEPSDFKLPVSAKEDKPDLKALQEADRRGRELAPQGVILSVKFNPEHWLSYGMGKRGAAFFSSGRVLMSKKPVETPVRFEGFRNLRLSGLLWNEARARIANSAYLTRERFGGGQIILFAAHPDFRAYYYGTYRLFLNAVFFGPGHGTRRKVEW